MNKGDWIAAGGGLTGLAALALLAAPLLERSAKMPIGGANGSFSHDCCGTLTLQDGKMLVGEADEKLLYSVGQDEIGPYVLPITYIGPWEDRGFEIDGGRERLRMRLDRFPHPTIIRMSDGHKSVLLKRKTLIRARAEPVRVTSQ